MSSFMKVLIGFLLGIAFMLFLSRQADNAEEQDYPIEQIYGNVGETAPNGIDAVTADAVAAVQKAIKKSTAEAIAEIQKAAAQANSGSGTSAKSSTTKSAGQAKSSQSNNNAATAKPVTTQSEPQSVKASSDSASSASASSQTSGSQKRNSKYQYFELSTKDGIIELHTHMPKETVKQLMGYPESTDMQESGSTVYETWEYMGRNKYLAEFTMEFKNGELTSVRQYRESR